MNRVPYDIWSHYETFLKSKVKDHAQHEGLKKWFLYFWSFRPNTILLIPDLIRCDCLSKTAAEEAVRSIFERQEPFYEAEAEIARN